MGRLPWTMGGGGQCYDKGRSQSRGQSEVTPGAEDRKQPSARECRQPLEAGEGRAQIL